MEEMSQPYDYNSYESSLQSVERHQGSSSVPLTSSAATATARAVVIEGIPDERRTSPIRRTFLLFVLFDFIAMFIIWVLYIQMMNKETLREALRQQVVQYSFRTSMFDMVVLAFWRLVVLELSYGVLKFNKPWSAAAATTVTCAVCLLKIFYYDFQHKMVHINSDVFEYIIVIVSFIITWIETWFLDFRVLPRERAALEIGQIDETTPLLRDEHRRAFPPSERYFSPIASSNESEAGEIVDLERNNARFDTVPGFDVEAHRRIAQEIFTESIRLLEDESGWTQDTQKPNIGTVYTNRSVVRNRNIYKLVSVVDVPASVLYRDMIDNIAQCPEWNPTMAESKRVQMLDEATDVIYSVVKEALGGAVSSRDFVLLRRWGPLPDGRLAVTSRSVEHPHCPNVRQHVRGVNGLTCVMLEPVKLNDREQTDFRWVLDSDIKGWIPSRLTDQALAGVLLDYMQALHSHAVSLRATCLTPSINGTEEDEEEVEDEEQDHFRSSRSTPT